MLNSKDKGLQGICRAIQGNMHANASHSLFDVSSFSGDSDDGFVLSTTASFAWFLAIDEKFVHFNPTGQFLTIMANGAILVIFLEG